MRGPWIVLAISICAFARSAFAQLEPPSHDDRSSGDVGHGDAGHGDAGYNDVGGHDSPSDSSPSPGGDSRHHDSDNASGSSNPSPSSSDGGYPHSHDGPDSGRDIQETGRDERRSPDDSAPPPKAHPRDPDSVEALPTDAQQRHPRPEAGPDDGRFPRPPVTEGTRWDDAGLGSAPIDYDGGFSPSPDYLRKRSKGSSAVTLHVNPGQADVYIDGHYAGHAKDIRGKNRLFLSSGVHELALVLEGYVPLRFYFDVSAGQSVDVRTEMVPLRRR